jgi:cytochrome c553
MFTKSLLSLAAASVLFTACGEETQKKAAEATTNISHTVKEASAKVVTETKAVVEVAKSEMSKASEVLTQKAVAVQKATEEKVATVVDSVSDKIADTKEVLSNKVAEVVAPVTEVTKEAETKVEALTQTTENTAGKAAYAKCAGCHGVEGKTKALGKSELIAGQTAAELETKIAEYKAGTRNVSGMGMLMKGQVGALDDAAIKAVSSYIAGL